MELGGEDITDAELIQAFIEQAQRRMNIAGPARVESYNHEKQTVEVTPVLYRAVPDGSGNYIAEQRPTIKDIPVVFQRGKGGYALTFPLEKGDHVLLVFCDRNIGAWRETGQPGDPGDLGMNTLDGAMAIPGVFPDAKALPNVSAQNMLIGKHGTPSATVELTPTEMHLGVGATKGIARNGDKGVGGTFSFTQDPTTKIVSVSYLDADLNGQGPFALSLAPSAINVATKLTEGSSKAKAVD